MKVLAVGEVLFDVTFSEEKVIGGSVGGSVLNALSTLASFGYTVNLLSEVGNDPLGLLIEKQIRQRGIGCHLFRLESKKTSMALAFLGVNGDADYSFYKSFWSPKLDQEFSKKWRGEKGVFLYGSLFSIHESSHWWLCTEIDELKNSNLTFIYDPNLRKEYFKDFSKDDLKNRVVNCMSKASLIKASMEDLAMLWGKLEPAAYYEKVREFCSYLVLTNGSEGVFFFSPGLNKRVSAPSCENVVSTIGAGDNLNAGIVSGIIDYGKLNLDLINETEWLSILKRGVEFGTAVCSIKESSLKKEQMMGVLK